ncbi:hypothetical protein [Actinomadura sp. HBU206391]|uniref:hypothetical protein n=1 Tax=Actinomadura sp. HBU206391 TaxID=2731692 RepID=UPI00164F91E5|nr:hypothetical protein [Actinomadura sp. HBU206391]MBC6461161.1 hypothetical protein [Actinomadura sp. HBU206391]
MGRVFRGRFALSMFLLSVFGPLLLGALTISVFGRSWIAGVIGVGFTWSTGPLTDIVGTRLNSRRVPHGREWHNASRALGGRLPVQNLYSAPLAIAFVFSIYAGALLHTERGTPAYVLPLVVGLASLAYILASFWWRRRTCVSASASSPERGAPLHIDDVVELSQPEATAGTTKRIVFTTRALCTGCGGRGRIGAERCRECSGDGLGGRTQDSVTIRIPPGTRGGTIVRVAHRGIPGVGSRRAGDLRLKVRLTGRTREVPSDRSARVPATPRGGTITSQHVQVTVDRTGFTVKRGRKTPTGTVWEDHLDLLWSTVESIVFETDRYDPVIALYACTTTGRRHHVMDSVHLNRMEWSRLADMIAESTGRKLTLDLLGRDDPRSLPPDA